MAPSMNRPLYTVEILRLAASIPHLGRLQQPQGEASVRSATCGSLVNVQVTLDQDGRVAALAQEVQACAFGQASSALMGAHAIGRPADEVERAAEHLVGWLEGCRADPGDWPDLERLAPARSRRGRHSAILLPFQALLAAIRNAEGRRP